VGLVQWYEGQEPARVGLALRAAKALLEGRARLLQSA